MAIRELPPKVLGSPAYQIADMDLLNVSTIHTKCDTAQISYTKHGMPHALFPRRDTTGKIPVTNIYKWFS